MTLHPNTSRRLPVAVLMAGVLFAVFASARAQDNASDHGVPQQIAELREQLAAANATIKELRGMIAEEATARASADAALQTAIDAESSARETEGLALRNTLSIHLPQYLINLGDLDLP